MNIILLSIWLKILVITGLCVYYNRIILNNYISSVTPKQPPLNAQCNYDDIPVENISNLQKCKSIDNIQTYIYSVDGIKYEISTSQYFYNKVCTGFCIQGLTPLNTCKTEINQKLFEKCENLLKPKQGCVSSAKPIINVKDGTNFQYYYAVAPINSLVSCS